MLESFDIIEDGRLHLGLADPQVALRERELIVEFINSHDTDYRLDNCHICGGQRLGFFATYSSIPYYRCETCQSVVSSLDPKLVSEYLTYEPILELRKSDFYQDKLTAIREQVWEELIFWIQYRAARYLGSHTNHRVIDFENRYRRLSEMICQSGLCSEYSLHSTVLTPQADKEGDLKDVDLILYFDRLPREPYPLQALVNLRKMLSPDGLLFISTRLGSGFDILTLRENNESVYPFEYANLPSVKGLELLLQQADLQIVELLTPGTQDVRYVLDNKNKLDAQELFIDYLINHTNETALIELQAFLQKYGLSSHARIIAKRT
jgi:hypothetical protein